MPDKDRAGLRNDGGVSADLALGDVWASVEVEEEGFSRVEVFVSTPAWHRDGDPAATPVYGVAIQASGGSGPRVFVELDAATLDVLRVERP